jgi:tetratricopeptide (TPR) repeat protein
MKRIFLAIILIAALSLHAAAPPRGSDRLRELVVFPEMNLTIHFGLDFQGDKWVVSENVNLPDEISLLRDELKQRPDDIKQLLRLGNLLDSNGETNDSKSCYQKAEQLCRNKIAVNPQDGLSLMDLGEALDALDQDDEAESVYRKATSVSSNGWKCWVRLGNFLANQFYLMFPKNLRSQYFPGRVPSQQILDYRPSADALKKSETSLAEASRCFDRAMALAPKEPEVFFQRAGYMCVSNVQNCFFRHFRDNEEISSDKWISAFFSPEAIANLQKAAELSPKNYEYISLAAYFDWINATKQVNITNFTSTFDTLPDTTRQYISDAMTRLENLSEGSDNEAAAGALENLGMLNIIFGNSPAAAVDLRRAVSLDPMRDQTWDLFLLSLGKSASHDEVTAICESRLKYKDSARNHLLLARAFEYQKKWDKAGEQAEAVLILEPDNLTAHLTAHLELAALALKQSVDPNFMSKASEQFTRIGELFKKFPASNEFWSRWREATLNYAIFDGLVNTPEYKKGAEECLAAVLKYFPNDEQAKEISDALD